MNRQEYAALFAVDQDALEKALLAVYNQQTPEEQSMGATVVFNNIGFDGADARTLSYCARWVKSGKRLSGDYLVKARNRMPKYWDQLNRMGIFQEVQ